MKKYYVTLIREWAFDEVELLKTDDKAEAIKRAQDEQYYIERDKKKEEFVEIRMYREDIEDEDCDCFDYDTLDF